jgi:folylpolyglutamate synthase/dihydropteroate synthase
MLDFIAPIATKIIVTDFDLGQDMAHKSQNAEDIKSYLISIGFYNVEIVKGYEKAYKILVNDLSRELVITGSLYLLSSVYNILTKSQ